MTAAPDGAVRHMPCSRFQLRGATHSGADESARDHEGWRYAMVSKTVVESSPAAAPYPLEMPSSNLHPGSRWPRAALLIAGAVCALALACAHAPPRPELPLQAPPPFSASGSATQGAEWWTEFHDADLNERIEGALESNFSLLGAWERLSEARAIVRVERAALFPQVDGTAGAGVRDGSDVDDETELSLGLGASYEVDLWGRVRASVDAERLRAAATAADYRAAAITLTGEVASAWYQLAEARSQITLIGSQIETNETVLDVLEKRFAVGQSGSADVLRQRQLVEATREQLVVARARLEVLEHLLAVLEGRPPQGSGMVAQPDGLPRVPEVPATGLPSELLARRPDVQAALLRIEAADQDVAEAVRDQYPRIDLVAAVSTTAENPSGLFDRWLASLAAQLVAPLYDGGRRRAEVERQAAARRGLLAEYGQVTLTAFQEVEDALVQERYQVERIARLEAQLTLAESTYEQLRTQYLNGSADFIDTLTSLREGQQLERDVLSARLDRVLFRISLYRALAGGFPTPMEAGGTQEGRGEDESVAGGASGGR